MRLIYIIVLFSFFSLGSYAQDIEKDDSIINTAFFISQSNVSLPIPNPVLDKSIISYKLPEAVNSGFINIYNFTGSLVRKIELSKNTGDIKVYSQDLEKGVYFYSLVVNGYTLHTKRMIVAQ